MDEGTRISARCAGCGARYKVPAADRSYPCKRCGGVVRALAEPAGEPDADPTCAACQAVLPAESQYCPECGHEAGAPLGPARRRASPEREARRFAAQDLRRAQRTIRVVRVLFLLQGFYFLALTASLLFALRTTPDGLATLLGVSLVAVCASVAFAGATLVAFHPFACSLSIASLYTLDLALRLALGGWVPPGNVAITLALWLLVIPTVRVARLVRAFPDLYGARKILGTSVRHAEPEAAPVVPLRRAALQSVAILAATAAVATVLWLGRPPAPDAALTRFAEAWNRHDAAGVAALFAPGERLAEPQALERLAARRGWTTWPRVTPGKLEASGEDLTQLFVLAGEPPERALRTGWRRTQTGWLLTRLIPPPPPIEHEILAFRSAWHAGDVEALARLYAPAAQEEKRASLTALAARSGWTEGYPALVSHEILTPGPRSVEVWFRTAKTRFRTAWRLDDEEAWTLSFLEPPGG